MQHRDVFIVHVFADDADAHAFRASVQRAGTDDAAWFTSSVALARYLQTFGSGATEDPDGARTVDSPRSTRPE